MVLVNAAINETSWVAINNFSFSLLKLVSMPETFSPPCALEEYYRDSEAF